MGLFDDLIDIGVGISGGGAAYKLAKLARNPPISLLQYRGELVEALEKLDKGLWYAEQVTEFTKHADKIEQARGMIGKVKTGLKLPSSVMTTLGEINDLRQAIGEINRIDAKADPIGAAKAYGAAMQGFGRLAQNLPPPASSVGELLEEFGGSFHKVVADIIPEERGTYKREIEKHRRGGVDITKW